MRHALAVVRAGFGAELAQLRRSRLLVALTVVQAVTFLLMVSVFGLTGSRAPTAFVNQDIGGAFAQRFAGDLAAAHHSFALRPMGYAQAQDELARGDLVAVVTIPPGFSADLAAGLPVQISVDVDNVNADLTADIQRAVPTAILAFSRENNLPGVHIRPVETALVDHETDFIPYLVVSALALDAFVVAGILAATAVAREFESRTIAGLAVSPTSPLLPLAGRALATSLVSAVAMALTTGVVVAGYGVVPRHPLELAGALLLCVVIFSCVGVAVGGMMRRTLPVASLLFGLALPLYIDSGSLEPERFDGNLIWAIAHSSPVYYAVGLLQHAVHGLRVTPEPMLLDAAALVGWAVLGVGLAGLALRRGGAGVIGWLRTLWRLAVLDLAMAAIVPVLLLGAWSGVVSPPPGHWPALLALFVVTAVCASAVGAALGSVLRGARVVSMAASVLATYLFFLGGGFTTIQFLPGWLRRISDFVPIRYAIDGLRQTLFYPGLTDVVHDLRVLLATALMAVTIGALFVQGSWGRS